MRGFRWVAAAAVIGLAAACGPAPAASPSGAAFASAAPSGSTPPATASVPPAPAEGVGTEWERIQLPGERPAPVAAVSGDAGLVIVGRTCVGANDNRCAPTASAWRSADGGATWQQGTVEDPEETFIGEVVYGGSYFAFGARQERRGEARQAVGIVWRSDDGLTWRRAGSIELGECTEEGCASASGLHVSGDGVFLLERVAANSVSSGTPHWSRDGSDWNPVSGTAFGETGDTEVLFADAISTSTGFLALGTGADVPLTAWTSRDGASWTSGGGFDELIDTSATLAAGSEVVAARGDCAGGTCRTTVWVGSESGQFQPTQASLDVTEARVAFTDGTGYVLVGLDQGKPAAFTSLDARHWDRTAGAPDEDCGIGWLAGGQSLAIFIGELGCGDAWITSGTAPG